MASPSHHNTLKRDIQSASPQRLKRRALTPEAFRAATVSAVEPMNLAGGEAKLSYLATGFNKPIEGSSNLKAALPFANGIKHSDTIVSNQIPTRFSVQKFRSTGSFWVARFTSIGEQRARQWVRQLVSLTLKVSKQTLDVDTMFLSYIADITSFSLTLNVHNKYYRSQAWNTGVLSSNENAGVQNVSFEAYHNRKEDFEAPNKSQ
ncbi:uncharacterized protein MELLADRAFT_61301 [Melampsora larici-populina 98AG31]|uniref:Uncharacterized protein n=1 Tax=Melampsora larici-populina (strain 98AG31 / pathotype 3-4-7) TaxID=747676 RepID=F4RED0_MELLP|nr:uncharacterized protein MELLADRAFT_61301 [Melampsora larici-populina 98AG31]EGG09070.1 hypothetical protein MELLADRAFT_61301 [Melampsora larici-populina 98AG31]